MLLISLIVLYFCSVTTYGYFVGKRESLDGFMVADRNRMAVPIALSMIVGWFDAGFILFYLHEFNNSGFYGFTYPIGVALGFLVFIVTMPKLMEASVKYKMFTMSDYFHFELSKRTGLIISFINLVLMVLWVIFLFLLGGQLLAALSPLSELQATWTMFALTLPYLILGGFKAVIGTDVVQAILVFVCLAILASSLFTLDNISLAATKEIIPYTTEQILLAILSLASWTLVSGDIWQRIYAAKNTYEAQKSSILMVIFSTLLACIMALFAWNLTDPQASDLLLSLLTNASMSPVLSAFALAMIFLAILSSLDTCVFSSATTVTNNLLIKMGITSEKTLKLQVRIAIILVMLFGAAFSRSFGSVMDLFYQAMGIASAVGPAIAYALLIKNRSEPIIFASMVLGVITVIGGIVFSLTFTGATLLPFFVATLPLLIPMFNYAQKRLAAAE